MGPPYGEAERNEMSRTTESMVEILRRSGPGALSIPRLQAELGRRRPPIALSAAAIKLLVEESEGRLVQLDVRIDDVRETSLDSWVLLMRSEDGPPRRGLASMLWHSLAALAEEVEVDSRTGVARWIQYAERASRMCLSSEGPNSPSGARGRL